MSPRRNPALSRARIQDAALAEFLQYGYDASTLEGVAARVGLTRQTLLYHYGSKEALLHSLVDPAVAAFDATIDDLESCTHHGPSTSEKQRLVLTRLVATLAVHRETAGLVSRFASDLEALGLGDLFKQKKARLAHLLGGNDFDTDTPTRIRVVACMAALGGISGARLAAPLDTPEHQAVLVNALLALLNSDDVT